MRTHSVRAGLMLLMTLGAWTAGPCWADNMTLLDSMAVYNPPLLNTPYSSNYLSVSGGTPPYHWSIVSATGPLSALSIVTMPAGATYQNATLDGTPTSVGIGSITVRVSDSAVPSAASIDRTFTLIVIATKGTIRVPEEAPTIAQAAELANRMPGYIIVKLGPGYHGIDVSTPSGGVLFQGTRYRYGVALIGSGSADTIVGPTPVSAPPVAAQPLLIFDQLDTDIRDIQFVGSSPSSAGSFSQGSLAKNAIITRGGRTFNLVARCRFNFFRGSGATALVSEDFGQMRVQNSSFFANTTGISVRFDRDYIPGVAKYVVNNTFVGNATAVASFQTIARTSPYTFRVLNNIFAEGATALQGPGGAVASNASVETNDFYHVATKFPGFTTVSEVGSQSLDPQFMRLQASDVRIKNSSLYANTSGTQVPQLQTFLNRTQPILVDDLHVMGAYPRYSGTSVTVISPLVSNVFRVGSSMTLNFRAGAFTPPPGTPPAHFGQAMILPNATSQAFSGTPVVQIQQLPGAAFQDMGNGQGRFTWTPTDDQVAQTIAGRIVIPATLPIAGVSSVMSPTDIGFGYFDFLLTSSQATTFSKILEGMRVPSTGFQSLLSNQVNAYYFTAAPGNGIYFSITNNPSFDNLPRLRLLGPGVGDTTPRSCGVPIEAMNLAGGTYTVEVSGCSPSQSASYAATLRATTTTLDGVVPTRGTLSCSATSVASPGLMDAYTFQGNGGSVVTLLATSTASGQTSVKRAVYDPDGKRVLDYTCQSSNTMTLPKTGPYVVLVTSCDTFPVRSYRISKCP